MLDILLSLLGEWQQLAESTVLENTTRFLPIMRVLRTNFKPAAIDSSCWIFPTAMLECSTLFRNGKNLRETGRTFNPKSPQDLILAKWIAQTMEDFQWTLLKRRQHHQKLKNKRTHFKLKLRIKDFSNAWQEQNPRCSMGGERRKTQQAQRTLLANLPINHTN